MKQIFLSILALISFKAAACETPEAEFIGEIKNHTEIQRSESIVECSFEIQFSTYKASEVCPLDPVEVVRYQFPDSTCSLKDGDPVSGVLARRGSFIVIE
jgi:hypothetical protein